MEITIAQSVLHLFLDNSVAPLIKKIGLALGADKELKKMSRTLLLIEAMLKDAEDGEIKDRRLKVWLTQLKEVAYDVEDMLDEFKYEDLRLKLKKEIRSGRYYQVSSLIHACLKVDAYKQHKKTSKIKEMRERIDAIAEDGKRFSLGELGRVRHNKKSGRPETSSLITDESKIFGRDYDKDAIIKLLIPDEPSEENVSLIPIVGMGGLGKTTLAQCVYNDIRVDVHFELKMWVCVSDDFNLKELTKKILQSAKVISSFTNLDTLQNELKETLAGKRFFLVLDDVWNEDTNEWDRLRAPFMVGAEGSKIIITTRNESVSQIMSPIPPYMLRGLTENAIWNLFANRAFTNMSSNEYPEELVAIGKQITKKCKGSPLAANSLGGLLRFKREQYQWSDVLESEILSEDRSDILSVLRLSYQYLSPNLKRCFAYCSIFPKDWDFKKDDLVHMWMAQGYIEAKGTKKPLEDISSGYFDDLLSRSFFQHGLNHNEFNMHNLYHDLAILISGNECVMLDKNRSPFSINEKARHASLHYKNSRDLEVVTKSRIPSFRTLQLTFETQIDHIPCDLSDLFTKLSYLRVLVLINGCIVDVPNSIGNLKLLRYLDLSHTKIERLPRSVSKLYNLQTLKLTGTRLVELPKSITKLINLRNLVLDKDIWSRLTSPGIQSLSNLQAVQACIPDSGSGCGEFLKLGILNLENAVLTEEARQAVFTNMQRIESLSLVWSGISLGNGIEEKELEWLHPHVKLETLEINGYNGTIFPSWMESPLFYLQEASLENCKSCQVLPSLGQLPSLKRLYMSNMDSLKCLGREFCGGGGRGFPSLEQLKIKMMNSLEVWYGVEEGDYPSLNELTIENCPKLKEFPQHLPALSIKRLYINSMDGLRRLGREFYGSGARWFPSLEQLEIKRMNGLEVWCGEEEGDYPKLSELTIENCPKLKEFPQCLPALSTLNLETCHPLILESLPFHTSLSHLTISNFAKVISLPDPLLQPFPKLEWLKIESCHELESLPNLRNFPSLQSLYISYCHKLASFPEWMRNLSSLENLYIGGCNDLSSLPNDCLPPNLLRLKISSCPQLASLPERIRDLSTLQTLRISDCNKLSLLPDECLPIMLSRLTIDSCPNLKSLPKGLPNLTSLVYLRIWDCLQLEYLPEDGLPTTLQELHIKGCPRLQERYQQGEDLHKIGADTRVHLTN